MEWAAIGVCRPGPPLNEFLALAKATARELQVRDFKKWLGTHIHSSPDDLFAPENAASSILIGCTVSIPKEYY